MANIALGTHLGDYSEETSKQYIEAISYALENGITMIDGAINYRGMCSEKNIGTAVNQVLDKGQLKREDICITSKAGLLFGDIHAGLNPKRYLSEVLEPLGITIDDFTEYNGLYQTLNPAFFEHALNKTLKNLGLDYVDIHYIHIPEISRLKYSEEEFNERMNILIDWYEDKVEEGKIKSYGIALEFMGEEPHESKWHFELEKINRTDNFKYVIFEYNPLCPFAVTEVSQTVKGVKMSIADACRNLRLETVGSMPFAMGDAFEKYSVKELLEFAKVGVDHVIVGSKNVEHIKEISNL